MIPLVEILTTKDDSKSGYSVDVDLEFTDALTKKTRFSPLCPEFNKVQKEFFIDFLKTIMQLFFRAADKVIYDWTDKKIYFTPYRILKFHTEMGMQIKKKYKALKCK